MNKRNILITHMGLILGGAETHVVLLSKRLKDLGYNVIVATNGGECERELINYGVKHYKVPLNTKKISDVIKSFFKLSKIIKEENIELIHAHSRIPAFICNILSKLHKVKFITTGHCKFRSNFFLKRISKWGDKTIVIDENLKEYYNKIFCIPYENMTVITNGIDTQKFIKGIDFSNISKEFNIDDSYIKISTWGRIDKELTDVLINLIDTVAKLSNTYEKIVLFIVGEGNRIEELRKYAYEINERLGKKVVFVPGGMENSKIPELINFSDVCVGISRSALECLSCEKPIVLAGASGYMGILDQSIVEQCKKDNFTGRSFNQETTPELLYEAISRIINMSEEEKEKIVQLERKIVVEDYSDVAMAKSTAKVYEELLENGGI